MRHNGANHNNGWHLQYSCCNEDAQSELAALNLPGRRAVAIAAAGGRAFSLLLGDPQEVTAFDINPVQIHLCLLKYHAIRLLDRTEYLRFIGIAPNGDRTSTYRVLSEHLPDDTRGYWDARLDLIESGLIGAGRYERSVAALSAIFRVTRGGAIARLRACADMAEQARLVSSKLWNPGWRLLFGLLFNPVMGRFVIRDKSFYGRPRRRASVYLVDRLNTCLENHLARDSFILELYTVGVLSEDGPLPVHLLEGNYEIVRKRLDRLSFVCEDIAYHLECREPGSVGAFSLSDLGSYLDAEGLSRVLAQVERTACVGATICLREFLCQPRLHAEWPKRIRRNRDLEERLGRSDRSMGYTLVCAEVE